MTPLDRRSILAGAAACLFRPATASAELPPGPEIPPVPPAPARPESNLDLIMGGIPPYLDIVCPVTGEAWAGWYYDFDSGRYDRGALSSLEWFFRDWRESVRVQMCVRLYWALSAAMKEAGRGGQTGPVELLSGYRTPATNASLPGAASDSMHMYGRAVDIRIPGIAMEMLASMMERLEVGGVGRYPQMNFVHIDSGRLRGWTGQS